MPLPKILASRLVASLRNTEHEQLNASRIEKKNLAHTAWRTKTYCLLSFLSFTPWILHYSIFKKCKRILAVRARLYVSICIHRYMQSFQFIVSSYNHKSALSYSKELERSYSQKHGKL